MMPHASRGLELNENSDKICIDPQSKSKEVSKDPGLRDQLGTSH